MKQIRVINDAFGRAEKAEVKARNRGSLSARMAIYGKLARPTANEPAYPFYTPPKKDDNGQ